MHKIRSTTSQLRHLLPFAIVSECKIKDPIHILCQYSCHVGTEVSSFLESPSIIAWHTRFIRLNSITNGSLFYFHNVKFISYWLWYLHYSLQFEWQVRYLSNARSLKPYKFRYMDKAKYYILFHYVYSKTMSKITKNKVQNTFPNTWIKNIEPLIIINILFILMFTATDHSIAFLKVSSA